MENLNQITQFFMPDSLGMFGDLLVSGLVVMLIVQATKKHVDKLIVKLPFVKKKPSTSSYTLMLCAIQVIFVMFSFNGLDVVPSNIYLTVVNTALLYVGCTKGFDFIFKNITYKVEDKKTK